MMIAKVKKRVVSLLSVVCTVAFAFGIGAEVSSQAEETSVVQSKVEKVSNGMKVTLAPTDGETEASFDYWNYVNVNELLNGELLQMKMMPEDEYTAEAESVVITLRDVVDSSQCIAIVVHVSDSYWGMNGTYGKVSLTDGLSVANNVTIKGTSQTVVGKTELVNGDVDKYTTYGAIDLGDWTDDKNGFFSAGQPSEALPNGKALHSLNIKYQNYTVQASCARKNASGAVIRTLANINSQAYFEASTNMLNDSEAHKALKNLYTHEHVENLFSSGYATLSFKFGGLKTEKVSFCIQQVGGVDVTECIDSSAPLVIPTMKTEALLGIDYELPIVSLYENSSETVSEYQIRVNAPSGIEVVVTDGKFAVEEVGKYTLTYSVTDSMNNTGEYVYEITAYETLPSVDFKVLSQNEPESDYVVRERLVVPAVCAYSNISKEKDNALKTSAVLYKDGKSVKTIHDVSKEQYIELTEAGEYEIVYVSQNAYGIFISQSLYTFSVLDKPIIISSVTEYYWQYGKTFSIPTEYCYYKGSNAKASVRCYAPNGELIPCDGNIALTEMGAYKLVYFYEVDGLKAETEVLLYSSNLTDSLFVTENNVACEVNYSYPNWAKDRNLSGLFVSTNKETAISYKNIIDLNELDKNTALLRMLPYNDESEKYGKYCFQVIVTSADDPSQKIILTVQPHETMWQYAYTHVNYDGRTLAFNTEDNKIISLDKYGCLMKLAIGQGYGQADIKDYTLSYEPKEKAFYINSNLSEDPWKLLDLDDAAHVGAGNEWKGFSSNKAKLEIKFYNLGAENAAAIITEIAGQSLGGPIAQDETAPKLYFDYSDTFEIVGNNLPNAEINKPYSLLQASAYDLVSGECAVSYGLYALNTSKNLYTSATHTFTQAGTYKYVISTRDLSGNELNYEYFIEVKESVEKITLSFGEYDEPIVGTWFTLPEITTNGGSGKVLLIKEVKLNDEILNYNALNEVYLNKCGRLTIKVSAYDYLGTEIGGEDMFTIQVNPSTKPVLSIGGVPEKVLAGKPVQFNDFSAKIYGDDVNESAYRAIIVDGEVVYKVENGVSSGSLKYNNTNESGTLSVRFVAGTSHSDIKAEKSFTIPVVSVEYVSDLLQPYNYDDGCLTTELTVSRNTYGSKYALTGNKGFELINASVADGFIFKLGGTKEDYQGQEIKVVLTDYHDSRISVSFTLKMIEQSCYMLLGDKVVLLEGVLNNIESLVAIEYDQESKGFLNASGNLLTLIQQTDSGLDFDGFTSGLMLVKIQTVVPVEKIGNSYTMVVRELGNVSFASADNDTLYSDLTGPAIGFKGEIRSSVYQLGTEINIPVAVASDMMTGETEVKVTIYDANYDIVDGMNEVVLAENKTLKLNLYGTYTLRYTARDANGRTEDRTFILFVKDETPPTLTVNDDLASEAKVGDTLKVPNFSAVDDNSQTTCKVYVYCPNGEIIDITETMKYKFSYKGTYKMQIYCNDQDGNVVQKVFEIKVR